MSAGILTIAPTGVQPAFDPNDRYRPGAGQEVDANTSTNPLDSEQNMLALSKLQGWWNEARDLHANNRAEQMIDADYKDGDQWSTEDAAVLTARGQSADSHNFIGQMINWVTGTERRTRVDWDVLPRNEQDVEAAPLKKELMKFQSDINRAGWERSAAFEDCATVGVGWVEEYLSRDQFDENLGLRKESWKNMWWDPYSINPVMKDCRYITRAKYIDLDYSAAMFPDRIDRIKTSAMNYLDPGLEMLQVDNTLPQVFWSTRMPSTLENGSGNRNSRYSRRRVLMLETWFKRPMAVQYIRDRAGDLDNALFDPTNPAHMEYTKGGSCSLSSAVSDTMACAIWTPGTLLSIMRSPYKHNGYPFTPCFAYRRHRDFMPYGLVRNARAGQDEYNKRRSKATWLLSVNRVIYEDGTFDEGDEDTMLDEATRPDGRVRVAKGAMVSKTFEIQQAGELSEAQLKMMESAKENIYEQSGVTRENQGLDTGQMSGKAIGLKQTQGGVTTASLFDNYRLFMVESGQKELSNIEQFMSMPKQFRVLGNDGAIKFMKINQMQQDPITGKVTWANDVTASEADFVIDQMDYRETVRQAQSAQLFDMLSKLPPELMLPFMGEALDLTDLPNKAALVRIARQVSGQPDPNDPNAMEQMQQQQAAKQQQQDAAMQADLQDKQADVSLKQAQAQHYSMQAEVGRAQIGHVAAQANKANAEVPHIAAKTALATAEAKHSAVAGKHTALEVASQLAHAVPLAPAADRLYNPDPPPGTTQTTNQNQPGANLPVAPQPAVI